MGIFTVYTRLEQGLKISQKMHVYPESKLHSHDESKLFGSNSTLPGPRGDAPPFVRIPEIGTPIRCVVASGATILHMQTPGVLETARHNLTCSPRNWWPHQMLKAPKSVWHLHSTILVIKNQVHQGKSRWQRFPSVGLYKPCTNLLFGDCTIYLKPELILVAGGRVFILNNWTDGSHDLPCSNLVQLSLPKLFKLSHGQKCYVSCNVLIPGFYTSSFVSFYHALKKRSVCWKRCFICHLRQD